VLFIKIKACGGRLPASTIDARPAMLAGVTCIRIASLDDPLLEPFRELKKTNATRWQGQFVVEGDKLVRRLLASGLEIESVLAAEPLAAEFESLLPRHVPLLVVPAPDMPRIVGFNFHRGILACGRRPSNRLALDGLASQPGCRSLVICPQVFDPENLGSIVRSSAALGADGIVLGPGCCDVYCRRVLRVSMGAVFQLPIVLSSDLAADLVRLRDAAGFELVAAVLDAGAEPLATAARPQRLGLVLGSEGHGLDARVAALCQQHVTIAMCRGTDSLNVAVATGVFLYHFLRLGPGIPSGAGWPSRFQENI
jgi:tRNA G18 (ribose-2'-O)-methylase SpoU